MDTGIGATGKNGSPALYRRVAERILAAIDAGDLAVGDVLPAEPVLAADCAVSRHTVREAMRVLHELGVVKRRPRVGTTICAPSPHTAYLQVIHSPDELLQYPPSRLKVCDTGPVRSDAALAAVLHCRRGQRWCHVGAVRHLKGRRTPIGWTDLYLLPAYADAVRDIGRRDEPVYRLLQRRFGQDTAGVSVDLGVSALNAVAANALGAAVGTPSFRLVRRYLGPDDRVFQISVTEHLPEQFQYRLQLRRAPNPTRRGANTP